MKSKFSLNLKSNFISGILVLAPIVLSIILVWWIFDLTTGFIPKLIAASSNETIKNINNNNLILIFVKVISLIFSAFIIYATGLITKAFLGKQLIHFWEKLIARIPILNTVYSTIQQVFKTFLVKNTKAFSQVVLIEYPRKEMYVIGFLTAEGTGELSQIGKGQPVESIFVPTTPNPTSGFLVFVPKDEVIYLKMTVTEAMQLVISGGTVKPNEVEAE
jgi:uncharacterized membrane protein